MVGSTNKISSKILTACYLLRRLKLTVSPHSLLLIYHSLLHSHLSYGILFWGASPAANRIFILQKRAIRILADISRRISCKPHFTQLRILTLPSTLIQAAATFVFNNPDRFPKNSSIHSHSTTSNKKVHNKTHNTQFLQKSPQYLCATIFNNLPPQIKSASTFGEFSSMIKSFLLSSSFYSLCEYLKT
jgi:hypothetical protein